MQVLRESLKSKSRAVHQRKWSEKGGRMSRESSQRDLQIFDGTVKKQEAAMGMFWAKKLGSLGSTEYDTQGTDGPQRRGESRTWCLDCQHASTFSKVLPHFPNDSQVISNSCFATLLIGAEIVPVGRHDSDMSRINKLSVTNSLTINSLTQIV